MKKYILATLIAIILSFGFINFACASTIFLNFDPPDFEPESSGNHSHIYNTAYGDITFNGRIFDRIQDNNYSDMSEEGYFLKNTHDRPGHKVTMTFDFDVSKIGFYWLGIEDINMHSAVYDIDGNRLASRSDRGTEEWDHKRFAPSTSIRSFSFWTTEGDNNRVGNRMAIDNLTLTIDDPVVTPEPATMLLFGLGLAPVLIRCKKRA